MHLHQVPVIIKLIGQIFRGSVFFGMNNKQHSNYGFVSVCCACARVTSPGETVAGRGVRRSGAERGLELHRFAWRTARRHQGEEDQVRQGDPAEGDAASRRRQRLLRDQEGLLPRVSTYACYFVGSVHMYTYKLVTSVGPPCVLSLITFRFLLSLHFFFLHFCKVKNQILSNRLCRLNAG